jgi:nucleotide-binding universal stress UspA family protein
VARSAKKLLALCTQTLRFAAGTGLPLRGGMTILCGTDFSPEATSALRIAADLAARMNLPLHVAHAVALTEDDMVDAATRAEIARGHQLRLESQAEQLRKPGMQIYVHVKEGAPDEVLLRLAGEVAATLIIVGALGKRKRSHWQLGSHADRVAQRSQIPVLVIRNPEAIGAWARDERALRIMLGADLTASTEAAMSWINDLARFGQCEVVAAHCYWPPQEYARLGLGGVRNFIEPVPQVTDTLDRELKAHLARFAKCNLTRVRIEPHLGRIGDRLAAIAAEEKADMIVVGSHERGAMRLWEGSVSRVVLQQSEVSVACVPAPLQAKLTDLPHVRSVLVATDFSPTGNAAVNLAYATAEEGAVIHLVHVMPDPQEGSIKPRDIFPSQRSLCDKYADVCEQLMHLAPAAAIARRQRTEVHVLESRHPADAIAQAAERLGIDMICIGTHGRVGIAKTILGSVAHDVLARTHRPVLLARKPVL